LSSFTIKLEGFNAVQKMLETKRKDVIAKVGVANVQVAMFMEGEVKASIAGRRDEHISVDTGNMMRSVHGKATDTGAEIVGGADYTYFIEEGTSKFQGRHHFRNSLQRNTDKINNFYNKKIKEII
jgi:hypothetical protein